MATLRELGAAPAGPVTLRDLGVVSAPGPDVRQLTDEDIAASQGQLRRGFTSGRLGGDANALRAEQAGLRADGREVEAAALDPRVQALRGRAATFAPAEQDVTTLTLSEPGRAVDWGLGMMGQAGASMLDPVALGAAANVAGTAVGAIPHPLAKVAGGALRYAGMAGGFGLNAQQAKGEFVEDAYQDPALMARTTPQALNTTANLVGAGSGALDTVLTGAVAGRIAGRPTMKALGGLGAPAKVGLDLVGEAGTEAAQTGGKLVGLGALNPERDTSGDANELINAAAGGFVGAAPISAASQYAANGYKRLGVKDDLSSDDVSGKTGKPGALGAAPKNENLTERLVRGAKQHADDDAAEAWNSTLGGAGGTGDIDADTTTRHDALMKELGGRAAKGDAVAKQHLDTLGAMDKANPTSWYDDAPRDEAYKHILGDGMDHAKVVEAYQGRRKNSQGAKTTPEAELAASVLQGALPEGRGIDAAEWKASAPLAASDLGQTLADLAKRKGEIGANDIERVLSTAGKLVEAYSLDGARSAAARVAMALGAEKTPAFQMLQKHLAAADAVQLKNNERKSRLEVADTLAKAIPTEARLALLKEGADLTEPSMRRALLDLVQNIAEKTGYGSTNPATGEPIVVKPSAYANLTSRLGPDGAAVAKKLLDMVAPGKVEEKEGAGEKKASGGGKTGAATESDEVKAQPDEEGDDWTLQGALKNIERAPGSKLYLAKGRGAVSSTDGQPFVPDKKTKNLPTLSTFDDTDDGKGPAGSGPNTLDSMIAKAWMALGGQEFNDPVVKVERAGGVTRRTTTVPDPMAAIPSAPGKPGAPQTFGVGSYRIRAASAREVMDDNGLSPSKRVELLKDYLARPGKRGAGPVLAKDDPTIQQLATLDRKIKIRDRETPKMLGGRDNPAYAELQDLKGQRKEVMAKLAAKIGVEVSEDATVPDLADAYFDSRFVVTAEQMAEKDQLRLDVAEVRAMVRRGNDDLDFTDQFGKDKVEVQASMNLIRFKSKSAVAEDGVAVIRANDLVEWVRENRNDKAPSRSNSPERVAVAFRNDLMEGIGALAADGHLSEMPYMLNEQGKKESFAEGFPPTLRLSGLTQGALDVRKAERAKRVTEVAGPPDADAVARDQAEESTAADPAVRRDEDRTARQSEESDGAPNEFRNQGAERGKADRKVTDPKPAERFWDAPELALTRTDSNVVPSETEPREQRGGVPTERTDIAMRTATINSALDGVDTLTMANAPAKAERMAEKLWGGLGRSHPDSSIKANPAAGWQNVLNVFKTLRSGKLQYAAPLARLLTPAHVQRLIDTAKDPAKARPMLRGLVGEVAAALANMPDSGFSRAEKTTLARLLTGNEKLVAPAVNGALKAMVPKAEKVKAAVKTAPVDNGIRKNSMAVKIHTDLERGGFAATHDSPIKHEGRFDWRKHLGKGEGNAAFGVGTYLSTADGVHRSYKEQFTAESTEPGKPRSWTLNGLKGEAYWDSDYGWSFEGITGGQQAVLSNLLMGKAKNVAEAIEGVKKSNADFLAKQADDAFVFYGDALPDNVSRALALRAPVEGPVPDSVAKFFNVKQWNKNVASAAARVAEAETVTSASTEASASPTYEVSVDIPQDRLLDWNKPISQQSAFVQKALGPLQTAAVEHAPRGTALLSKLADRMADPDKLRASDLYTSLGRVFGSQAKVSDALQAVGILGHRYNSEGSTNDTHPNYVIYDDSKITTNYVHFNQQATKANATGIYSDAEVAKAKAHFAKVLGPQITVLASETFPDAGEWNDAEQTARLSTAIGPGVLSVAYHESMHGLWSRLIKNSPKAAEVLAKTFSSPAVLDRLKAELANEPAALAAITTGPHAIEERVAYGYQFWAAGLLDVDKPATTLFAKMRKMLRKVLGMVRESETALELMTAFHDGKLAESSAAGRVIDKIMKAQTWNEDVKRKFDKQVQGVFAAVATSNSVLRNEALSATARKLGMTMFTNPGEATAGRFKRGYINARRQVTAQYTNYLYDAIKGLSDRDMAAVVEELQLQREPTAANLPYAPVRQAVERVQALTQRYWTYATGDAGMKLEFLGKYHYPRVWSLNAMVEGGGKDKFIAMLMQPKYAKTMKSATDIANENLANPFTTEQIAEQMYQHLIEKNGVDDKGLAAEQNDLLAPFFASQKERSFKWLDNEDVRPFLEKDLVGAMSRYLHQGVRAAEYVRRFGEGGKDLKELLAMKGDTWINPETDKKENRPEHGKIAGEIEASLKAKGVTGKEAEEILARHMEDIKNSVEAHEGSLGRDITPTMRKFSSAAMAYQNLRLLPLSLFAAFGDTIGIAGRYGDGGGKLAFQAFLQGLKDVYARWKDAASDVPAARQKSVWEGLAEMIGAVDSHMFLEQMGKAHTSEFMTDFARKANRALFMANGLTAWDRSMRVSATKAAVLFLQDHAGLPDKQHSKRWLAELGLTAKDIPLDAEGKLITDRHVLAATKGIPLEQATKEMERVHFALTRWVEGAILTPNAGQRPTWASDPHYAVLFHLKQFTYSFQDTILKRAFNEASHGNMNPIGALAAAVPTMIAADIVKGFVVGGGSLPDYMKAWDAGDWVAHGIQRAGHLGVAQFGVDALNDPTSLAGPTVDQATDFIWNPTEVGKNVLNAIPGARMIGDLKDMVRPTA